MAPGVMDGVGIPGGRPDGVVQAREFVPRGPVDVEAGVSPEEMFVISCPRTARGRTRSARKRRDVMTEDGSLSYLPLQRCSNKTFRRL